QSAKPPPVNVDAVKNEIVEEREQRAADDVDGEAQDQRPPAVSSEKRADEKRKAHARNAEPAASLKNGRHRNGRNEAPEDQITERHLQVARHRPASFALLLARWRSPR